MEIGINISNRARFTEQIKYFKELGVGRTFVNANHPELDDVMKCLAENAIVCETLHAPYNGINNMWKEGEDGDIMLSRLLDCVLLCQKYNVPVLIVHISSGRPMTEISEIGDIRYARLVAFAAERGVTVAFENLSFFENLDHVLKIHPKAKFCYDCGHESCRMTGVRYMPLFGDRACALHIHDNLCELDTDNHYIPFDGRIDFDVVARDIAASGFCGTLMLELKTGKDGKYESLTDREYFERAVKSARRLAAMIENYKSGERV